jgi:hypothetical protein
MEESVTTYPESRITSPHIVAINPRGCNDAAWEGTHLWTEGRRSDRKATGTRIAMLLETGRTVAAESTGFYSVRFQHAQLSILQSPMRTSEACAPQAFQSLCDPPVIPGGRAAEQRTAAVSPEAMCNENRCAALHQPLQCCRHPDLALHI